MVREMEGMKHLRKRKRGCGFLTGKRSMKIHSRERSR